MLPFVPSEDPLDPGTNESPDVDAVAGWEEASHQMGRTMGEHINDILDARAGPRNLIGNHPASFIPGPVAPIPNYPTKKQE
jgi:hypothetical protein